jgi:hypothetical protein
MTTPTVTETHRHGQPIVGERVELARYTISSGERIVYGQRVGGVRVTDLPASGQGRSYLVERELEQDDNAALQALLADYLQQARVHDHVPMLLPPARSDLEHLDAGEGE